MSRVSSRAGRLGRGAGLAAALTITAVGLAACASSPASSELLTSVSESPTSEAATADAAAPASTHAPDGVTGDAALAWEALMGPAGEYAAAANYAAVIDVYGDVQPYVMIKASEEKHISALTRQLERFGVDVPENPYLGTIAAPGDLEAAAKVEAGAEVANVEMYDTLLSQTGDTRLTRVFTNLRRASEEAHLPMFEAAAANGGTLTEEQLAELGHGDHEPGMGDAGRGMEEEYGMGGGGHGGGHGNGGGRGRA